MTDTTAGPTTTRPLGERLAEAADLCRKGWSATSIAMRCALTHGQVLEVMERTGRRKRRGR